MERREIFLSFSPPWLGEEEIEEVIKTLRSDWVTTGPKTKRFEEEFTQFIGGRQSLALSSGTGALHAGLAALGVGEGDAVMTTTMTFCSGIHVIEQVGAHPVLVDIEPDTLNIDPSKVEEAFQKDVKGKKVKALIPVHFAGHPCEMDVLKGIVRKQHCSILEDAAHALPAQFKGVRIGTISELTAFSFYATKNMTTGEGGMLSGDPELIRKARVYSLHGIDRDAWNRYSEKGSWYYEVIAAGFKYNMMDLQAAIGLHQLRKLSKFHQRRKEIFDRYQQAFSNVEALQVPVRRSYVEHSLHLYILRLHLDRLVIGRDQFVEELKKRNIGSSVHYIPNHMQPYYQQKYGFKPEDFPVAYQEYLRMLSLPLYPRMTDNDIEDVINAVLDIVKKFKR